VLAVAILAKAPALLASDGQGCRRGRDEETYIRDGLGLDPSAVGWALKGLEITG
jgi:hypothetical protein